MRAFKIFLVFVLIFCNSCGLFNNSTSIEGRKFFIPKVPYKTLKFSYDLSQLDSKDLKIYNTTFLGIDSVSIPDYFQKSFSNINVQAKNESKIELRVIPINITFRSKYERKKSKRTAFIFELMDGEKTVWKARVSREIISNYSENIIKLIDDVRDYLIQNEFIIDNK
jgi:hypothetical protein